MQDVPDRELDRPEGDDRPVRDPDEEHDVRVLDDRADERSVLLVYLGTAINHIATHASFDQKDLIQLLKRARKYIDGR